LGVFPVKLPERLLRIASYVPQSSSVADIGTDHALLPAYLVLQGICSKIIATDMHAGPLESARATVAAFNLWEQVELRQGDGLSIIRPGEVSTIIIAGMGGVKINGMLNRAADVLRQTACLILQPLSGVAQVRRWLSGNGWRLVDEDLLIDNGRFYEIIVAEPMDAAEERLPDASLAIALDIPPGTFLEGLCPGASQRACHTSDDECELWLEIGPRLLVKKHPLLVVFLSKQIRDMESVLKALKRAQTPAAMQRKEEWARKIDFFKAIVNKLQ